jgi:hypothetical protein
MTLRKTLLLSPKRPSIRLLFFGLEKVSETWHGSITLENWKTKTERQPSSFCLVLQLEPLGTTILCA